jgi:hypothetical protein
MSQFSQVVNRSQAVGGVDLRPAPAQLPQAPLLSVERIIREVVFPGFRHSVRLFLKEQTRTRTVPRLSAVYLAPPFSDGSSGPGPVIYPVSLAALSLILGLPVIYGSEKPTIYRRDLKAPLAENLLNEKDYEWLRRSGKDRLVVKILEALIDEARGSSYPGLEGVQQYETLLAKLTQGMAATPAQLAQGTAARLEAADFYHEALPSADQTRQVFICVPFPQRSPAGVVPELPEVATLVVTVNPPPDTVRTDGRALTPAADGSAPAVFTDLRIGMLETLAELIGTMLIASSALDMPRGVWDERFRP